MNAQRLAISRLINSSGSDSSQDITLDEMFGWYLNITFAVLFVFMIASFLFRTELKEEAKQAQEEAEQAEEERDFAQAQLEGIEKTDAGQQYLETEKALISFQRQELINALAKIEAEDRQSFGLSIFSSVAEIISGDKVFDNPHTKKYFIDASVSAKEKLPYLSELRANWLKRVLKEAKKRFREKGEKRLPISDGIGIVEESNQRWLNEEISKRTGTLYNDYCEFQASVLTHLYKFYFQNPKSLDGTEVAGLLSRYFKASPEIKSSLLKEIDAKLYNQAKKTLESQGVMILSGASE